MIRILYSNSLKVRSIQLIQKQIKFYSSENFAVSFEGGNFAALNERLLSVHPVLGRNRRLVLAKSGKASHRKKRSFE